MTSTRLPVVAEMALRHRWRKFCWGTAKKDFAVSRTPPAIGTAEIEKPAKSSLETNIGEPRMARRFIFRNRPFPALLLAGLLLADTGVWATALPAALAAEKTPAADGSRTSDATLIHDGLAPKEAAAAMTVPRGFRVQLAAGEPDVHQPIAMAIDHRGRLWVAEAHTYPIRAPEGRGKDKILILEDTNGDGSLDLRKVFIEGLNLVSGLEVGFGGVWVGAAPYLLFIPDADGDDRPDGPPKKLLDGFGYHDTHETLNSFIWGPDGWLYGCHGVFTRSRVGKPGTPDADRVPLNAGVWRYHPQRRQFEVFAWGTSNPWGVDFNDYGQAMLTACVIPHVYHIIQGARYQRQAGQHFNPHVYDDIKTIADHLHYFGSIRDHAWWGKEPRLPETTSKAGGGHAHCGAMIYLGDAFPAAYRNTLMMNNVHGNRVNNEVLVPHGSGYIAKHGRDFLMANDHWFRGINLRYGPDGGVYLIDWYDKQACHRRQPETWDRTNGRVYKITYGRTKPPRVDLAKLGDDELVKLQLHANDWYVRHARRILQSRGGNPKVHAALIAILRNNPDPTRKLRALWALHVTDGLNEALTRELLANEHPHVRAWTIQLMLERGTISDDDLARLEQLARDDSSPVVRLYLASAMQRLETSRRSGLAAALCQHAEDVDDHNLPLLVWYGVEPLVAADPARALSLAASAKIPLVARYITRRAASERAGMQAIMKTLGAGVGSTAQLMMAEEVAASLKARANVAAPEAWGPAYEKLMASNNADVKNHAQFIAVQFGDRRVFPHLRQALSDTSKTPRERRFALDTLLSGHDADVVPVLQAMISERAMRIDALQGLALFDHPGTPAAILRRYASFSDDERRAAVGALTTRPSYAKALLNAIEAKMVPGRDVPAYAIRQLRRFKDAELENRIKAVWGVVRETTAERRAQIAALKRVMTPRYLRGADLSRGRLHFNKSCVNCHMLYGAGAKIGPDLTGSNRGNLDYILENILDPSAVVGKDYQMLVIATTDGRVLSGLVLKETDSALTLRTVENTVVVAKSDIDTMEQSKKSIMPDGLLKPLNQEATRDLIGYLASRSQTPIRGTHSKIDPATGRVAGAVEGESMTVLRRDGGEARVQSMSGYQNGLWSGSQHLWWMDAKPGDQLVLELKVAKAGRYRIEAALTKAADYGVVQIYLDDKKLDAPLDLYHPQVTSTGPILLGEQELTAGNHRLTLEVIGANAQAKPRRMVGLDYVNLTPAEQATEPEKAPNQP